MTFGSNIVTFPRVIIPTSRRSDPMSRGSRMWKFQRHAVRIQHCDVAESPLSQHRDVLERVEI